MTDKRKKRARDLSKKTGMSHQAAVNALDVKKTYAEPVEVSKTFLENGPEGPGWYVHETEYPEEGYFFVSQTEPTLADIQKVCPEYVFHKTPIHLRYPTFKRTFDKALDEMARAWEQDSTHALPARFQFDLVVTLADGTQVRCVPAGSFSPKKPEKNELAELTDDAWVQQERKIEHDSMAKTVSAPEETPEQLIEQMIELLRTTKKPITIPPKLAQGIAKMLEHQREKEAVKSPFFTKEFPISDLKLDPEKRVDRAQYEKFYGVEDDVKWTRAAVEAEKNGTPAPLKEHWVRGVAELAGLFHLWKEKFTPGGFWRRSRPKERLCGVEYGGTVWWFPLTLTKSGDVEGLGEWYLALPDGGAVFDEEFVMPSKKAV